MLGNNLFFDIILASMASPIALRQGANITITNTSIT